MKTSKWMLLGAVAVIAAVLLAACGGGGGGTTGGGPVSLNITAKETGCASGTYCFDPATATANAGADVTVKLTNPSSSSSPHSFELKGVAGATVAEVAVGKDGTVTFKAPAAGTYDYICTVPGHEALGMKGTLTVK